MAGYRDLDVWWDSIELSREVYQFIKKLPSEERYALADQMRRAVVSIPSNIAEGQARRSEKEFLQFLRYAQGSKAEIETQFEICIALGYFSREELSAIFELLDKVGRKISSLAASINRK